MPAIRLSRFVRPGSPIPGQPWGRDGRELVIQLKLIGRADPADIGTLLPALTEAAAPRSRPLADRGGASGLGAVPKELPRASDGAPVRAHGGTAHRGGPAGGDRDRRAAREGHGRYEGALRRAGSPTACRRRSGSSPTSTSASTSRSWVRPQQERHVVVQPQLLASSRRPGTRPSRRTTPRPCRAVSPTARTPSSGCDQTASIPATRWTASSEWSELPDEIHVLEFGVGDGQQAQVWLDTFGAACAERGRDYRRACAT